MGLAGTAASAYRMSIVAKLFNNEINPVVSMSRIVNLILWSQIEVDIVILCANVPAVAGFLKTVRARRKTLTNTTSTYALQSPRQNNFSASVSTPTGPRPRDDLEDGQEHIVPKGNRIVQSTEVDVSIR
ncbi:MAG: hypothetical protein M1816_001150 [Peltula sp. TS41687]|nr:MAG: hypothetical protein M1816_001150 [Peltula sp. TS41687]